MTYPEFIEVEGKRYKLDTSYKTALRCFDVINDHSIDDTERAYAVIFLLLNEIPKENQEKILKVLKKYLQCGKTEIEQQHAKDMDFRQDEKYIQSSFIYDYNIDLSTTDMHWWKFIDLLDGLSSECILSRVRDIRTMDISIYKDLKTRERLMKAKYQVRLKQPETEEEKQLRERFERSLDPEYESEETFEEE